MKNLIIILIFLFASSNLFAQLNSEDSPVSWLQSVEKIDNNKYELSFIAELSESWCVYSQYIEEGGPVPTSVHFDENKFAVVSDTVAELGNAQRAYDNLFEMNVIKYYDSYQLKATVTTKTNEEITLTGYIRYMCCTSEKCLPPKNVPFQLVLN